MKYQYLDLLCAWPGKNSLEAVAEFVYKTLGVARYQMRESSNYINGYYFKGMLGNTEVAVQFSDEADCEEMPYWISIFDEAETDAHIKSLVDFFSKDVLPMDFRLVYVENMGYVDGEKRIQINP